MKILSDRRWLEMSLWDMFSNSRFSSPVNRSPDSRDSELFCRNSFCRLPDFLKMLGGRAARLLFDRSRRERDSRPDRELSDRTDNRLPGNIWKVKIFLN